MRKNRGTKFAKFVSAGVSGGVITELILLTGLLAIYRNLGIPSTTYSSSTLLSLNILAQGVGIAVSFFINEKITVNVQNDPKNKGKKQLIVRLLKFEGTNGIGSGISILTQLLLLATLSVSPALGNIVGEVIGSAVAYVIVISCPCGLSGSKEAISLRIDKTLGKSADLFYRTVKRLISLK